METIDGQCHCSRCEDRTKETYSKQAVCTNCEAGPFVVVFRKGDRAYAGVLGKPCPNCEVSSLMFVSKPSL